MMNQKQAISYGKKIGVRYHVRNSNGGLLGGTKTLEAAKEMQKTKEELLHIIADHTGQLYEKILVDADRDYWMNSQEAVEYGMVDFCSVIVLMKDSNNYQKSTSGNMDCLFRMSSECGDQILLFICWMLFCYFYVGCYFAFASLLLITELEMAACSSHFHGFS